MVYWETRAAFGAKFGIISHLDGHLRLLCSKKKKWKTESVHLRLMLDGRVCTGMKCLELGLALGTSRPHFIHLYSMMDKGKEELSSSKV